MKKLLTMIAVTATVLAATGSAVAAPKPKVVQKPSYCGNTAYDHAYAAVYAYPNGSYWVSQIASYPKFYQDHNAEYLKQYGC